MNNVSQGHHLRSYFNRSMEVTKMNFSQTVFYFLMFHYGSQVFSSTVCANLQDKFCCRPLAIGFSQCRLRNKKHEFTINNSYYQRQPTPMSHPSHFLTSHLSESHSHAPPVSSPWSAPAWDVVPNHSMIKRGEVRGMCRATRQLGTFFTKRHTATRRIFCVSLVTCNMGR